MSDIAEGGALLRAVLEKPEDDAPRLIYADWLEENGDGERAEFIRLQCESKSLMSFNGAMMTATKDESLMRNCGYVWLGKYYESNSPNGRNWNWSRGFISEIRLTCAEFVGGPCGKCNGTSWITSRVWHGPTQDDDEISTSSSPCEHCKRTGQIEGIARELFERHPLTRVVLVDKKPLHFDGRYLWHNKDNRLASGDIGHQDHLPEKIHSLIRGFIRKPDRVTGLVKSYRTESAALNALSDACVAYGRELVGLPPLVKSSAA